MDRSVQTQTQINQQKGDKTYGLCPTIVQDRKCDLAQACMAFTKTNDQIFGNAHRIDRNENG